MHIFYSSGLSLAHTRGHLWRSILEGVCLGTKGAIDALAKVGLTGTQIKVAGGATRSELFLQMHADATGLPVVVTENDNAPLLGSALLAGVGVGWFKSSDDEYDKDVYTTSTATDTKTKSTSPTAISKDDNLGTQTNHNKYTSIRKQVYRGIQSMIRVSKRIEPNITATNRYKSVYKLYSKAVNRIADISHTLATGTHFSDANSDDSSSSNSSFVHIASQLKAVRDKKRIQLAPSLLSADFGHLASEAKLCEKLGLEWLHIDVCDGSEECRGSFTIGPQTVAAIRRECPNLKLGMFTNV